LIVENPGKIPENVGNIRENLGKIPENLKKSLNIYAKSLKFRAKMAPNVCRKISEDHIFGGHTKNWLAKVARKLYGQVFENLGKNPLHPQTYACTYTYA